MQYSKIFKASAIAAAAFAGAAAMAIAKPNTTPAEGSVSCKCTCSGGGLGTVKYVNGLGKFQGDRPSCQGFTGSQCEFDTVQGKKTGSLSGCDTVVHKRNPPGGNRGSDGTLTTEDRSR